MINKSSLDAGSYFYLNNNHQGIITNLGYPFLYKKPTLWTWIKNKTKDSKRKHYIFKFKYSSQCEPLSMSQQNYFYKIT